MRRLAALTLPLLLLTACGDGNDNASPTQTTPPSTSAPTDTARPTGSTTASETPSGGTGCPLLAAPAADTTVIPLTITGGKVDPPRHTVSVKLNSLVRLEVKADAVDEVHVHTYDDTIATIPGCTVALEFKANIPATVEVELEKSGLHIVDVKAS